MKTAINTDIAAALSDVKDRSVSHVFLVACGGSLAIMYSGKYFLDRHAKTFGSDIYNAHEFLYRAPLRLDENAVVILCSQTGTTRETVEAAAFARSKGATTIAMTLDAASPLASAAEHVVGYKASYTTGQAIDAADSNYATLYMLLAELVRIRDGNDMIAPLLGSLSNLQTAIDRAHVALAPQFEDFAPRLARKNVIYTLAAGPTYAAAYSFAICVLMEMQWINSQAIHANEYFHGPFEVTDENSSFVVLIGLGETRRLEERARDFAFRFGAQENILTLDAAELDLEGLDGRFRAYLAPLIFFDTLWRFAYRLAELRSQPMLEGRRYMKRITDY